MHPSKIRSCARRLRPFSLLAWVAAGTIGLSATGLKAQEGDVEAGQVKAASCVGCHGPDGNSISPQWPSLAGQHPGYTARQLQAYKDKVRADPGMQTFAAVLSEQDMHDLAAYFASQELAVKGADPALVDRAEAIYRGGIPERGVAACIACHGPTGQGNPLAGYPRVSHQHATYLASTLRAYQAGIRLSDAPLNQMMRNVAEFLLDDEIDALASYMQGLN